MPTTQFPMEHVAAIGLIKMDLLGLSNLTILERAVELIEKRHGMRIALEDLADGDPKTFEMLGQGETFGVFQLESAGMRRAVVELKPTSVDDLAALVALYRPGPMQHIGTFCRAKHGLEKVSYPHPDLADILDETYGVIVFQDQVLKIAQKFAGYSLGAADIMRKAMGKKIAYVMQAERERFISGAIEKGYSQEDAERVFDLIEPFAGYAFNKAHSYAYGTIAYQTAYLKANYPARVPHRRPHAGRQPPGRRPRAHRPDLQRVRAHRHRRCCRRTSTRASPTSASRSRRTAPPPSASASAWSRTSARAPPSRSSKRATRPGGAFATIDDFCRNLNTRNVNKRALESLAKAGALDSVAGGPDARGSLLVNLDRILSIAQSAQKLRETGQSTMFDLFGAEVATPLSGIDLEATPLPRREMLAWEKELLGVWLSEHPFTHAASHLRPARHGDLQRANAGEPHRPADPGPRLRHRRHRQLDAADHHARRPRLHRRRAAGPHRRPGGHGVARRLRPHAGAVGLRQHRPRPGART